MSMSYCTCPRHFRDSDVKKVTERVSEGSSQIEINSIQRNIHITRGGLVPGMGFQNSSGVQITETARKLLPPPEPRYKTPWGCFSIAFPFVVIFGFIPLSGVAAALKDSNPLAANSWALVCVVLFIIAAIIFSMMIVAKKKEAKERLAGYALEHPRWEQAMNHWNNLYHCSRCGIVFDPQRKLCVQTEEMMTIL